MAGAGAELDGRLGCQNGATGAGAPNPGGNVGQRAGGGGMPSAERWAKMQSGAPWIQNSDRRGHRYKVYWMGFLDFLFFI